MCPLRDNKLKSRRDSDGALVTSVGSEESTRSHREIVGTGRRMIGCSTTSVGAPGAGPAEVEIAVREQLLTAVRVEQPTDIIASGGVCFPQRPTCFVAHHTFASTHAMKRRD